jgi:ornithine decarboxylase
MHACLVVAVKCNPDPYVLRLLAALGTGFDCASNGEIAQVLCLDVSPDRIIFANPCKALSFIKYAANRGVNTLTFDNEDELYKVARINRSAKLVLRILTDDSKSLCRLGLKFGAPLATVPSLLIKAKELGLDVIGISFHVGSGCYDSSAFADAVGGARAAFDMGLAAGYNFSFLDVGGGFEDATFEVTAGVLREALDFHFPDRAGLRIIAEPGRYFVSRAFSLAANIIARRAPPSDGEATEIKDEGDDQPSLMCMCSSFPRDMCQLTGLLTKIISMTEYTGRLTAFCSTISRFIPPFCL